jgi:ATP-binding cassette subfamily F protein uup
VRQGRSLAVTEDPEIEAAAALARKAAASVSAPKKLGFREQRELDGLPKLIESLEARLSELQSRISDPALYAQEHALVQPVIDEFQFTQRELDNAIQRWTELEDQQQAFEKSKARDRA